MIPEGRKKPHGDRMSFIMSQIVSEILRVQDTGVCTTELASHCLCSRQSSKIYTIKEANVYLSIPPVIPSWRTFDKMRKPQTAFAPPTKRSMHMQEMCVYVMCVGPGDRYPQTTKVGVCWLMCTSVALHSFSVMSIV